MHYLVTGGAGFIGSHLSDLLVSCGHSVTILDNLSTGREENVPIGADFVVGDVCDEEVVEKCMRDVDGCFHLAAVASVQRSVEYWHETNRTNLGGTIVILNEAREKIGKKPIPIVLASSAAVYGSNNDLPLSETDSVAPISAYGLDKLASEMHAKLAWNLYQVPVSAMRFFNVYGPRQDPRSPYSGVISIFYNAINSDIPFSVYGDGYQFRDFIYVQDVANYLYQEMLHLDVGFCVNNVCTGVKTDLRTLISAIEEVTGKQAKFDFKDSRPGDIERSLGNSNKIKLRHPNVDVTDLREGFKMMINFGA